MNQTTKTSLPHDKPQSVLSRCETPETHPATIVLRALEAGLPVELDGMSLVMEDGKVWMQGTRSILLQGEATGETEEVLLSIDLHLNGFLALCRQLPDNELFMLAAATALRIDASKKAKRRQVGEEVAKHLGLREFGA